MMDGMIGEYEGRLVIVFYTMLYVLCCMYDIVLTDRN